MASLQTDDKVSQDISALTNASREELVERWNLTYGRLPPKGISRRLLERSAAYDIQEEAHGGLKPQVKRQLTSFLAYDKSKMVATPKRTLATGTRLVREWNGRSHTVEVLDKGYAWNGDVHKSLSAIAFVITGARWSGPRFFGL